MDFELKQAPVGRYTLRYLDVGSSTPVVLIHGLAGDHTAWLARCCEKITA